MAHAYTLAMAHAYTLALAHACIGTRLHWHTLALSYHHTKNTLNCSKNNQINQNNQNILKIAIDYNLKRLIIGITYRE